MPKAKAVKTNPKANVKQEKKEEILGTASVAERLQIDPKRLRAIIRANAEKTNGGARYEFRESDIPALQTLVAEHTRKAAEEKSKKA